MSLNNNVSLFRPGQAVWYHSFRWPRRWLRLQVQLRYVPCACVSSYNTAALCSLCLCEFVQYSCMMSLAWVCKLQLYNVSWHLVSSYNTDVWYLLSLCEFVQYKICIMSLVLVWVRTIQLRYVPCPCVSAYNIVALCPLSLYGSVQYSLHDVPCPCVCSYNTESAWCPLSCLLYTSDAADES